MRRWTMVLAVIVAALAPNAVRADTPLPRLELSFPMRVNLSASFDVPGVLGHQPARVLEQSSGEFATHRDQTVGMTFAAEISGFTRWFEFSVLPYTVVPQEELHVNLAGIELYAFVPVVPWLRLGLYHHSAHNFPHERAYERLGFGTNLDGLVLDVRPVSEYGGFLGREGWFEWAIGGHWYPGDHGNSPAHVITADAEVPAGGIVTTEWRWYTRLEGWHPYGHSACRVRVLSSGEAVSSGIMTCDLGMRLWFLPLGWASRHLLLGPELSYGRNFTRQEVFGTDEFWGAIRLEVELVDSAHEW